MDMYMYVQCTNTSVYIYSTSRMSLNAPKMSPLLSSRYAVASINLALEHTYIQMWSMYMYMCSHYMNMQENFQRLPIRNVGWALLCVNYSQEKLVQKAAIP